MRVHEKYSDNIQYDSLTNHCFESDLFNESVDPVHKNGKCFMQDSFGS